MRTDLSRQHIAARAVVAPLVAFWLIASLIGFGVTASFAQQATSAPQIWTVPEIGALPDDDYGRLVRRGRDLVSATYAHIGPEVADPANALPATISLVAIVTFRPERRSSASRCSACTASFPATASARAARLRWRIVSIPA
jgi:hypothetical protein